MPQILHTFTFQKEQTETLSAFLVDRLNREHNDVLLNKEKICALCFTGLVKINNKIEKNSAVLLSKNDAISIQFDTDRFKPKRQPNDILFSMSDTDILFEDDLLIIVNKPALFPVEQTVVRDRDNLFSVVSQFMKNRVRKPEDTSVRTDYLGMHHRLDHHTSGVILFSKNQAVNSKLHDLFEKHIIQKEYIALCYAPGGLFKKSTPIQDQQFAIINRIDRITPTNKQGKWGEVQEGGEYAETHFHVIERNNLYFHVSAKPITGRTHQIRAHLSGYGLPLLGDPLYGGLLEIANHAIPRTMLHAKSITFPHPETDQEITVSAPFPEDFLATARACNFQHIHN